MFMFKLVRRNVNYVLVFWKEWSESYTELLNTKLQKSNVLDLLSAIVSCRKRNINIIPYSHLIVHFCQITGFRLYFYFHVDVYFYILLIVILMRRNMEKIGRWRVKGLSSNFISHIKRI